MKYFLLVFTILIGCYATCNAKEKNLTAENTIVESISKHATPSSVYSDCLAKNSVAGAGGNLLHCQTLACIYARVYVDYYCTKKTEKETGCFDRLIGKDCREK